MSYKEALRTAIARELTERSPDEFPVSPSDIVDIAVRWDDGDRYDPTYGDSPNAAPTFEVQVTLQCGTGRQDLTIGIEMVFTTLLKAVLETGI